MDANYSRHSKSSTWDETGDRRRDETDSQDQYRPRRDVSADRTRGKTRGGDGHGRRSERGERGRSLSPDRRETNKWNDHERSRSRSRSRETKEKKRKRDRSSDRKARKAEKKRLRAEEEARQVAELSVYSATDNPFHDTNLGQQFHWHKKAEKERKSGMTMADSRARDLTRRQEAQEELARLNKRRAEREAEMLLREEEEIRMQRLAESAAMAEWTAKEGDWALEQERKRATIRIREKRAKAIDFLALNLRYANPIDNEEEDEGLDDAGLEIDLDEPYHIFDNLTPDQTEDLHDDIQNYLQLEQSDLNIDFWTNMMVVCKDRIDRIRISQRMGTDAAAAVESDIDALLVGKSYDHLVALQGQIQSKLSSGEPVDVDYWENLLKKLLVGKAKAKLKAFHEVVVRNRLEQLRKRQRDEALQAQEELLAGVVRSAQQGAHRNITGTTLEASEPYDRSMSPPLMDSSMLTEEERGCIISSKDDLRNLLTQRRAVAATRYVAKASQSSAEPVEDEAAAPPTAAQLAAENAAAEAMYRAEMERDLDEEEEAFNTEAPVSISAYAWGDKYRPRKPRYFNRVHTGYEWNKYNQTHYDTDNPPPKVVQGYKFNIFYPDLIDKSKAPTYKIIKEPDNDDTVLLYFTAGPPYEDIAFRIVNREWEYSHKRGFRSSFDRGCLSLWFNFRRNFYRK